MANETVLFKRGDSATITSTPVTDGQILFDTSGNGKMYLDNGTDRLEMGGAITVDASLSKTSTNAIQNKAVTGNILNSLAEVSAATQQNTIAGALALKEVNSRLPQYDESTDTVYLLINGEKIILKEYATSDIKYETFNNIVSGSAGNSVTFTNSLSFKPNEVLKVLIINATWSGNSGNVQLNSWSYNPSTNAITVSVSKDVDTNTATITYQIVYK